MRLLADENTHGLVVERLRTAGYDVEWVKQTTPGALDVDILARSDIASLILITNDRDFGDLVFNKGQPTPFSILYTRLPHRTGDATADRLIELLEKGVPERQMITVTKDGMRAKPFPIGANDG